MCEIFYMENPKGLSEEDLSSFFKNAVPSGIYNKDGFGVFNNKARIYRNAKQYEKSDVDSLVNKFKGSQFVVMHLRAATSGSVSVKNTHPFVYGNYILCHNGILYNNHEDDMTDSEKLVQDIAKCEETTIQKKIKTVLDGTAGSASCFLYDFVKKELYYFRSGCKFTFGYFPKTNTVTGATDHDMINPFIKWYRGFFGIASPTVYTVKAGEAIYHLNGNITRLESLETPTYCYTTAKKRSYEDDDWYLDKNNQWKRHSLTDKKGIVVPIPNTERKLTKKERKRLKRDNYLKEMEADPEEETFNRYWGG